MYPLPLVFLTELNSLALCGLLSGILGTIAYMPYVFDTLKGRTRPQRASWLIWSILSSITFFSQLSEGATDSLWFAGVKVSGTLVIFLLSISWGAGGFLNRKDCVILVAAGFGLWLSYTTETALYALAITISIGLLGGAITVVKAYFDPDSETISAWTLSFFASILAIVAVGRIDWMILAYPLYLFTMNGAIVAAMLTGRMRSVGTVPSERK